jgi:hypothetical protein
MPLIISQPFSPGSYARVVETCGGTPGAVFQQIGLELSQRFFRQVGVPPPGPAYLGSLWTRIWDVTHREGLPAPLAAHEIGAPAALDSEFLELLTEDALSELPVHRAADHLRVLCMQVFTALLSAEFRACRQSFQEEGSGGACLRQDPEHCRDRLSGSHCEDCPFFVALSADQHRKLLERSFPEQRRAAWQANRDLFLPEDFRALRVFWHLHLRQQKGAA